ncbi:hypothetical protein JCM10213_007720 [Rhodosporidiobolus nylandii]
MPAAAQSDTLPRSNHVLVVPLPPLSREDGVQFIEQIRGLPSPSTAPRVPGEKTAPPPPPAGDDEAGALLPWRIKNRYYVASVAFRVVGPEDAALEGGEEPAVVVLAQGSAGLEPLLSRLSAREPEFDVALLCTLPPSSSSSSSLASPAPPPAPDQDPSAWEDLALDHGFEWVPLPSFSPSSAPAASPSTASPAAIDDAEADEREGLPRVREALEAHLWPGLERLPPPSAAGGGRRERRMCAIEDEGSDEDYEDGDFNSALGAPPLPDPRPYVPPKVEFPGRFLPALLRGGGAGTEGDEGEAAEAVGGDGTLPAGSEDRAEQGGEAGFEDDFSPFIDASSSSSAAVFPSLPSDSITSLGTLPRAPLSGSSSTDEGAAEGEEGDNDDELAALFERVALARGQAQGMDMDARRKFAERMVRDLLGGDEDEEEDEGEREGVDELLDA